MSATLVRGLIALGALVVLGAVNYGIAHKEGIMRTGEIIYLQLAPVDPRSLMQGDYMALQFELASTIAATREKVLQSEADRPLIAPLRLDQRRIASLGTEADALNIRYRMRGQQVWLGTNAYFFEEGSAERYAGAKFGEFRLDRASGEAVLVALCDGELRRL